MRYGVENGLERPEIEVGFAVVRLIEVKMYYLGFHNENLDAKLRLIFRLLSEFDGLFVI